VIWLIYRLTFRRIISKDDEEAEKVKLLTIYDITDNRLRGKIARKCLDFGLARVQKSCFAGDLSMNRIEMLEIELRNLLNDGEKYDIAESDAVYILPMCETCFFKKILLGYKARFPDKDIEKYKII
jgi:CRISPR-associated protein Cas2